MKVFWFSESIVFKNGVVLSHSSTSVLSYFALLYLTFMQHVQYMHSIGKNKIAALLYLNA